MKDKVVTPYQNRLSKKEQVAGMFNHIAHRYDFLNHFLSLGVDRLWRKRVVRKLALNQPSAMLDVATGTGDLAIAAARKIDNLNVQGIDIAMSMLERGKQKIVKSKLEHRVQIQLGDAENIGFDDNRFDCVTAAFGVRNFENVAKGLSEMHRVTKPGGQVIILEFSQPGKGVFAFFYRFYFRFLLPLMGKIVSGNNRAYTYLPESVEVFPDREAFTKLLGDAGFANCSFKPLTFGVACMYTGHKA
ncbi:MAG: bifunctional demethylmenaquinone methyltransferase/2-methoxy-6-polyprenyl-1,4-benzoquinol methylase UbiE [Salinivirgaceae bacterium]|nr:bifunctional demethylmenaquinone methyltransferase/2-methoxy-6-polyprenyl-1,4-benzoquinol methylase UbiE [Salinivirgaceae bacterium]